ncbi:MAG: hypothetical protein WD768_21190 [Phycisphaeraceae bacterium]
MNRTISLKVRLQILQDLMNTEADPVTLSKKYRLDLIDLSRFALDPETRRQAEGLLVLADVQTQFMLSRYRVNAASTLFGFISPQETDEKVDPDLKRKACVDLLRVEMKRTASQESEASAAPEEESPIEELRELLYGVANAPSGKVVARNEGESEA